MQREDLSDLAAFLAVADEKSFTRAAGKLGTSQSTLSYTIKRLETRLGLRLLTRTTRSVAPTDAGERLIETLRPALDDIDGRITALKELRAKPSGVVRITTGEPAAELILMPALSRLLPAYPDVKVELTIEYGLTDIVRERFDAGIRLGEQVAKDMIAVPIGPGARMAVVGTRAYFAKNPAPKTPRQLADHLCINLRLPTRGGLYAWEFEKNGRALNVRVEGQLVLNTASLIKEAAMAGLGLACLPQDTVQSEISRGKLVRVLGDWCPVFPGYHLYYPSRRQQSPALALLIDALRYRAA